MDNKMLRSTRTGIELLILSSLGLPALAQAQTGPGYAGPGTYPQYYQSGRQAPPVPRPYGAGPARGPGAYGMEPGQGPESYGMGGPQGGPGQMGGPGMRGGPQGGPGEMGGPGMMGGPQGGPGQMGGPGLMGGPQAGPGQMGGLGMMGGPQAGPGQMGGPGTMAGAAAGGPAMAMLDAVGRLDLTAEQRAKLDAIRADLNRRQKELLDKIAAETSNLQQASKQQVQASQTLSDLRGHLMFANLDAANRAEEMLTKEQRQTLVNTSAHVMTPEREH
jgi:hypothetical protein